MFTIDIIIKYIIKLIYFGERIDHGESVLLITYFIPYGHESFTKVFQSICLSINH